MSKTGKRIIFGFIGLLVLFGAGFAYHAEWTYRFLTISENKVYKSGVIPLDELPDYIADYKIKTVIDLRKSNVIDPLNPAILNDLQKEEKFIKGIEGVSYVNIPSEQIPNEDNLEEFYKVLDNSESYPVLIHCHHGTGRAALYSALYRVEYENQTPDEARTKTRLLTKFSSFDHGSPKGEWLKKYKPRRNTEGVLTNVDTP